VVIEERGAAKLLFFCVIYVIYVIGDWGFLWEAYSVKNPGNFLGGREL